MDKSKQLTVAKAFSLEPMALESRYEGKLIEIGVGKQRRQDTVVVWKQEAESRSPRRDTQYP